MGARAGDRRLRATPREIIVRLNREINEIFQLADIRTLFTHNQIQIGGRTSAGVR